MTEFENEVPDLPVQDELETLKARADALGISYHPSIGLEKLRDKVNKALTKDAPEEGAVEPAATDAPAVKETEAQKRMRLKREAGELVRIRLTCMNPAKREWEGEIFTSGNAAVGTFSKFVPFNADDGWHVPRIIYNMIVERQCQVFTTERTKNGVAVRKGRLIKEFAVEVLPPLTEKELAELARRQAVAKSVD